jgi:hypothetical protein
METETDKNLTIWDISIVKVLIKQVDGFLELFLLFKNEDIDVPLMLNGQICFLGEEGLITVLHNIGVPLLPAQLQHEVALTYNLDNVIDLIKNRSIDKKAKLINFINVHLDMIAAININLPDDYKRVLYPFADHLTFNKRYDYFLKKNGVNRETLLEIILWINGVVFSNWLFFNKCDNLSLPKVF